MMKYILILSASWLGIFIFPSCGGPGNENNSNIVNPDGNAGIIDTLGSMGNPGDSSLILVMDSMIRDINRMSLSEHFDVHYAKLMIRHHQGAIEMAKIELVKGRDAQLKSVAESLINRYDREIKVLEESVHDHKPKPAEDVTEAELKESISKMMTEMNAISIKGDTDKEFAEMMMLHLRCAVEISAQEVIQGHHVQLKLTARDMIRDDQKLLQEIKSWLDAVN